MSRSLHKVVLISVAINTVISTQVAPRKELNDGNKIPIIALGTASRRDIPKIRDTINWAVSAGYRHIDTATLYQNERQIGQGIADVITKGLVNRADLFITTKLPNEKHAQEEVLPELQESLQRLGLDYVDLYLIHWPMTILENGTHLDTDYLETWKGMEEVKKMGLAKSIGVSNFNSTQLDRLIANSEIPPAVNQIEVNPTLTQEPLVDYCEKHGIAVMAYCPFGFLVSRGKDDTPAPKADDPILVKIAEKYNKTTPQIVLRYLVDRGLIPIPKSTNPDRIPENINILDFKLTEDEIKTVNAFNKNIRVIDRKSDKHHPYFPFEQ